MKLTAERLLAMISAMACWLAAPGPVFSADGPRLPDPVRFTVSMELGDMRQAEAWLDAGLPPDFMGSRIGSGLMIAAWEGKPELMRLFISRGADINLLNANGESAIALAAWRGNLEAVQWLVDRGARINAPARHWSALHYAVFAGHEAVADYLIEQGADINAQSTNGSSVLMMAVYEGRQELAGKLVAKGALRSPKNDLGDGALDWAMRHNRLELARLVSAPDEFAEAVNQPKEKWGTAQRSLRTSPELETLLTMREKLVERGMATETIDRRIASERVRIVRAELDRPQPALAPTLEITARRGKPAEQSANIVYDAKGKATGYKVPPATVFGTPKMPPKGKLRNY